MPVFVTHKINTPASAHIQKRGICYTNQGMDSANKVGIIE
jgi:hypothetical protein